MNKPLIFVTTGTQLPFDRLIGCVDEWAEQHPEVDVVAQTAKSERVFSNLKTVDFIEPKEYRDYVDRAEIIVGHAGIGTIITCLEKEKPVILMARKFSLNEHRNDHQQSTVDKFKSTEGIYMADDEDELKLILSQYYKLNSGSIRSTRNRESIIFYLRKFIEEEG